MLSLMREKEETQVQVQVLSLMIMTSIHKPPKGIDDAFFKWNWAGACWNCWAGPLALDVGPLCKNKEQKRIDKARPLHFRCLS